MQKFLSKKEIAIFNKLNSHFGYKSIFEIFIYCKCISNGINKEICDAIINKLYQRTLCNIYNDIINITEYYNINIYERIDSFIKFISQYKKELNENIIADIMDFLADKDYDYNYKGRTFRSLINCAIAWHQELNRINALRMNNYETTFKTRYPHGPFREWSCEENGYYYTCRQIRFYKQLCEEGRIQHHCVSSYHGNCLSGFSFIYTLRKHDSNNGTKILATIEVSATGKAVQVRGLMNAPIKGEAKCIYNVWEKQRKSFI